MSNVGCYSLFCIATPGPGHGVDGHVDATGYTYTDTSCLLCDAGLAPVVVFVKLPGKGDRFAQQEERLCIDCGAFNSFSPATLEVLRTGRYRRKQRMAGAE